MPGNDKFEYSNFYKRGSQEKYSPKDRIFLTFQPAKLSWISSSLPLHELGLSRTIA